MQKHYDVVIVGAGPTGLTLALFLARQGFQVAIADKNPSRSIHSKALALQAGPLELFEKVFGSEFADRFVKKGKPAKEAFLYIDSPNAIKVRLDSIPSKYNFVLIIEQSETEKLLEEALSEKLVSVMRETELNSFEQNNDHVSVTLKKGSDVIQFECKYLIGCDGAHSTTRHLLDLPFKGATNEGNSILGDVEVEWPWDYESIRTFISKHGTMACFPMRGQNKYRFIIAPKDAPTDQKDISLKEFEKYAKEICPYDIKITEGFWLTRFRTNHRIVGTNYVGRVFLAGDAAHIHSPVGGQGMNVGVTDAINLGSKLTKALRNDDRINILDHYRKERLPVARRVLRVTEFFFRIALVQEFFILNKIRSFVFPIIIRFPPVQRIMTFLISQIGIARIEIRRLKALG
jgi:3-(3-hydroxy-phenyl)propionate hydroxylase